MTSPKPRRVVFTQSELRAADGALCLSPARRGPTFCTLPFVHLQDCRHDGRLRLDPMPRRRLLGLVALWCAVTLAASWWLL